jgi:hypothetical protein
MAVRSQLADIDPVLVRLHRWAGSSMTRAAVAKKLGVSRAAVAGWFLALEAIQKGEAVPASGRVFRYTDQVPDVQVAIARALREPVDRLLAESLGPRASRSATDVPEAAGELLDVGRLVLGEIGSGRTPQPLSLAHRVAEVVESVTRVPTLLVPEPRGSDRADPYQYQLVVFYAEPTGPGNVHKDENDLMKKITEALKTAALPAYWEHGVKTPDVQLAYPDLQLVHHDVREWKRLGSLVIPNTAMSHAPSVGLLVRPNRGNRNQRDLRYATIVTSPYGGSDPVGGYLSFTLAAGHIRALDVVRALDDALAQRGHDERRALISQATILDTGYAVQKTLHLLQDGAVPGAWIMSMETELPHVFEPLRDDLVRVEGPLMLVRLGPQWQRMAAWRLAAARLNMNGRTDGAELPWSCDQVDFDTPPSPRDLEVLRHQFDIAQEEDDQLAAWDELMVGIARQRAEQGQASSPTFEVVLDPLPEEGGAVRFDRGSWELVSGAERFEGMVMFPDSVDGWVDAWVQATADLLDELARLAGYRDASALAGQLNEGPVQRVIEHRRGAGSS